MDTTVADPLIGRVLDGRYTVESRIARGGMATVYVAVDSKLGRRVAVKVMHPSLAEDEGFVARFRREAYAAAGLSSPYVVEVFDAGTDTGPIGPVVFLVLELVRGRTLRHLLDERGRLSPDEAGSILDPVLGALAAAHAAGLVHRDIKPENVLLADDGRVKVADFGLARAVEGGPNTSATGVLIGTVGYLAPEQVVTGRADARSDVYAAGVLLYELLTGRAPFEGDTPLAVAYRHVHERVPPPGLAVGGIPPAFDELVLRATAQDPDERPADGAAMRALLREARTDPQGTGAFAAAAGPQPPPGQGYRATQALRYDGTGAWPEDLASTDAQARPPRRRRREVPPPEAARDRLPRWARRRRTGLIVLALLLIVSVLAAVAAWSLGSDGRVHVPDLTGRTVAADTAILKQAHLKAALDPRQHSESVPAGDVISASPAPGNTVAKGGTVHLVPSSGPDRVAVPPLAGRTVGQAQQLIRQARLTVGQTSQEHSSVAADHVISSNPSAGAQTKPGNPVNLVVSLGPQMVTVPDTLTGESADDATRDLAAVGLKATIQNAPDASFFDTPGMVTDSDPGGGSQIAAGSTVTLFVVGGSDAAGGSGDGSKDQVTLPDVRGQKASTAKRRLEARGFHVNVYEIPFTDGHVINESPDPGNGKVDRGSTVTLVAA